VCRLGWECESECEESESERGRGTSEDEFVKFVDYRRKEEEERVWDYRR